VIRDTKRIGTKSLAELASAHDYQIVLVFCSILLLPTVSLDLVSRCSFLRVFESLFLKLLMPQKTFIKSQAWHTKFHEMTVMF
jgi:hypothetical protein